MRNTKQQDLIYNIVEGTCSHPTAEMVYDEAKLSMPRISLGTVYRVLKNLEYGGKILRIPMDDGDRYDKTTCTHAHFYCTECGRVSDISIGIDDNSLKMLSIESGNTITHFNATLSGICKDCANKQKIN